DPLPGLSDGLVPLVMVGRGAARHLHRAAGRLRLHDRARVRDGGQSQAAPLMSLLEVRDLTIAYRDRNASLQALDRVSFSIEAGEALGIVGESGCGKSTLAKAILALL